MKVSRMLASAGATAVVIAGLVVSPALAWHPQAEITKSVQDVTTNSQTVSATAAVNVDSPTASATAADVITVAPGDTLKYVVVVNDPAQPAGDKDNDLASATVTDTLPQGVQLTNGTAPTQAIADLAPGQSKTYEYDVKVTDQTDGDLLTNKACIQGNSAANDVHELEACSLVTVKVHVPPKPTPTPTPTPTPKPTPAPQQPTALPNTGAGNFILPVAVVSVLGYAGYLLRCKRRSA